MQKRLKDDIDISGFAGVRERVYVMDSERFGMRRPDTALDGIGPLHYLADAFMRPEASTGLHRHEAVVIVTVMLNGALAHRGSLGDGQQLGAGDIQVQWAGATGFSHNEINPGPGYCRFLQLWLTPTTAIDDTGYTVTALGDRGATRVPLPDAISGLSLALHALQPGEALEVTTEALVYVASGSLEPAGDGVPTSAQTLIRAHGLHMTATDESLLLVAQPA